MAQRSDDDNNVCKRKRLTGSSKWTMNAISRQIAERQANLDIENMVMLQQDQSSEKICGSPMDLEVSPIYMVSRYKLLIFVSLILFPYIEQGIGFLTRAKEYEGFFFL